MKIHNKINIIGGLKLRILRSSTLRKVASRKTRFPGLWKKHNNTSI